MKSYLFLIIIVFGTLSFAKKNTMQCQGAKLRIINKITTEQITYDIPLSQTLELDNAKVKILKCLIVEDSGVQDQIALLSHKISDQKNKNFLGWIFKSSQYVNSPVNPIFDIKLEKCLLEDPIFLKKQSTKIF
ncbi:MAG: DUF2155 domain-containing protein [Alphaproteobacteria bacterium]